MWQRAMLMGLAAAVLVGILGLGQALAQQPPGDRRGGDRFGPRDPEEMRKRIEAYREQMQDRMRERLGATEEEWKILQPRIEKVSQAMRQSRGGFRSVMGMFGGRGRGGPDDRRGGDRQRPEGTPEREQDDVEKKTQALRSLLDDENSSASSIKAALDALRSARQKSQEELATARKELREVITARQEAQLVLMGTLD